MASWLSLLALSQSPWQRSPFLFLFSGHAYFVSAIGDHISTVIKVGTPLDKMYSTRHHLQIEDFGPVKHRMG